MDELSHSIYKSKYVDCVSVQRQKDRLVLGGVRGCHLPPKSERDMGVERSAGALGGEGVERGSKRGVTGY